MRNRRTSKKRKISLNKNGYPVFNDTGKPVHRYVAEKKLGRKLHKGEVVHHKDRNKNNNSISNLHIFTSQKEHDFIHKVDAKKYGVKYSYTGRSH